MHRRKLIRLAVSFIVSSVALSTVVIAAGGCAGKDNTSVGSYASENYDSEDNDSEEKTTSEVYAATESESSETEVVLEGESSETEVVLESESSETEKIIESESSLEDDAENEITVIMVGDILLHTPVEEAARDTEGHYNYDFIFANMKDEISAADIAIVNEEVIIGGEELGVSGYPAFNAPYEVGDALVNAGFDVICHATNHALDKGKSGLLNCASYWEKNHPEITMVGINKTEDDYSRVDIIEKKGIRIAILNYTYGTNGIPQPEDMPHAVDMLEEEKVIRDLQYAEVNADITIVCPHWGTEYRLKPDDSQNYWTDIFMRYGADVVVGTHPHVIEPIEVVTDEETANPDEAATGEAMAESDLSYGTLSNNSGDGEMLVYYSLGNFVNWTSESGDGIARRNVGGMAKFTIEKSEDTDAHVKDYGIEALICQDESGFENVTVYPLSEYTEELSEANEIKNQDSSFSKEYCINLCNEVWGKSWE